MTTHRFRIVHKTHMEYEGAARASHNELRMTPLTEPGQTTLESRLRVRPLTWSMVYRDYWGTHVTAMECLGDHDSLEIEAASTVERNPVSQFEASPGWSALQEPVILDRYQEWLSDGPRTRPGQELRELALECRSLRHPRDAAEAVIDRIRSRVNYFSGVTGVHTRAEDAWSEGGGVCQDFAHLTVGALRLLGIPARYVSGYLSPRKDAEVGETGIGESHAWVEFWDGAWIPADPTNGSPVASEHVTVARGRDYSDVPPVKGVYSGPGIRALQVEVSFTRIA